MVKEPEEKTATVNQISDIIGNFGKWQGNVCLFCTTMAIFSSWNNLPGPFYAPSGNYAIAEVKKDGVLLNVTEAEACLLIERNETLTVKWIFDTSISSSTIISEWNLVCEDAWLASFTQSVYMVGIVFSALIFGYVSDKYGRLPALWSSIIIEILAGLSSAFSVSILHFTISRFFVALGCYGRNLTTFLLGLEAVGPKYRAIAGILYQFGWATGYVTLPGIAYYFKNFRTMMIATTIPEVLWLLWLLKVPESLRWQLTNGQAEKAKQEIMKAVQMNNLPVDNVESKFKTLKANLENESKILSSYGKAGFVDLWTRSKMRLYTLVFYYTWFVNAFVYYGIALNIGDLGGNLFLSFVVAGLVEYPFYLLTILAFGYIGRRKLAASAILGAGLSCLAIVPFKLLQGFLTPSLVFAMIGKGFITASFAIVYVYSAEVYPTVVRQLGVGTCSVAGRAGSILAPFVKELTQVSGVWVSLLIFGLLSVVDFFLILLLPETMNQEIPDTFEDIQRINTEESSHNRRRAYKATAAPEHTF